MLTNFDDLHSDHAQAILNVVKNKDSLFQGTEMSNPCTPASKRLYKKKGTDKNETKLASILENMLMCISEHDPELAISFRKELDALEIKTTTKTSGKVSGMYQMRSYPESDNSSVPF